MSALYDEILMDHIKSARNYRMPETVSRELPGSNALCGDEMTPYLSMEDEHIEDIGFQCSCYGISMASASIMTEIVKGKKTREAKALLERFIDTLSVNREECSLLICREQQAILEAVRKFPARARWALLPWATLRNGLEGQRT